MDKRLVHNSRVIKRVKQMVKVADLKGADVKSVKWCRNNEVDRINNLKPVHGNLVA